MTHIILRFGYAGYPHRLKVDGVEFRLVFRCRWLTRPKPTRSPFSRRFLADCSNLGGECGCYSLQMVAAETTLTVGSRSGTIKVLSYCRGRTGDKTEDKGAARWFSGRGLLSNRRRDASMFSILRSRGSCCKALIRAFVKNLVAVASCLAV